MLQFVLDPVGRWCGGDPWWAGGGKVALRRIRRSNRAGLFSPVSDPVGIRTVFMVRRCVRGGVPRYLIGFLRCVWWSGFVCTGQRVVWIAPIEWTRVIFLCAAVVRDWTRSCMVRGVHVTGWCRRVVDRDGVVSTCGVVGRAYVKGWCHVVLLRKGGDAGWVCRETGYTRKGGTAWVPSTKGWYR